jgi:ABC-type oligopeptide transport system substrate-binding subunit
VVRKQFPFATALVVVATLASISACGSEGGGSSAGDTKGGAALGKGMAELPVEPTESPSPTEDPTDDPTDTPTGGGGLVTSDAKMGTCGWGSNGIPYANVKITNSDSTTSYYSLLVGFVDSNEDVVTTGMESDAAVAGNSSKTIKVLGLKADSSKKAKKCRLSLGTKSKTAS